MITELPLARAIIPSITHAVNRFGCWRDSRWIGRWPVYSSIFDKFERRSFDEKRSLCPFSIRGSIS